MKKLMGIFVFMLLMFSLNCTDVSGQQSGIWELANSPYNVTGDISVPGESSLEIEAGVIVNFMGDYQITAEGRIIAQGNEEALISFKAENDVTDILHQGIRLEYEGAESNIFDYCYFSNAENAINSINSPANITNSHFSYNDEAIHIFAIGNNNPPLVHIEGNLIENSVKSGILIAESSNVMVVANEIRGNGTGPQFRGAIQISIQTTGMPVTPTITENNIHNNHYQGITCVDMFSSVGINAQIYNNVIAENYTGVYFYNCSGTLYNNQIINNHIDGDMNSGAGIMCYGNGATPYIAGNLISGNYGGIYLTVGAQPVIGAPEMNHPYAYGLNIIEENIDVNGDNNSVILNNINSSINILAKNNFWGTNVTSEIDQTIYDSNDNSNLGTVVYLPLASENDEYTLSIDVDSELNLPANYTLQIRNLETMEVTNYEIESLEEELEVIFTDPVKVTITGYYESDNGYNFGHCYYGPFDELNIVTLDEDNPNESITVVFSENARENTFKCYENIQVNGIEVTPLLKDEFYTDQVKQLLYENDNNEIMLVGYQKYGPNGWETVTFDEEYLYLKNDAQTDDTFTNHQVSLIDGQYNLYSNSCQVIGVYTKEIAGEEVIVKVVNKILDSPWDMETSTVIEFIGDCAPHSINTRTTNFSDFFATSNQVNVVYTDSKLLSLNSNIQVDFETERTLLQPTNLIQINNFLYWNPCSMEILESGSQDFVGYSIIWENDSNPNNFNYEHIDMYQTSYDFTQIGLYPGASTIWVAGHYEDGLFTDSTNCVTIFITSNDENDVEAQTTLLGNYPNPFNPQTFISYELKTSAHVSLSIYNVKGQRIKNLVDQQEKEGKHTVIWDGTDSNGKNVTSGLYFYKMKSGKFSSSRKMILLK